MSSTEIPQSKLDLVRKLLAQAEHPNTSATEAEAFTAKAATLMAAYGIERAHLAAAGTVHDGIGESRITMTHPYSRQKAHLLAWIADAMRCKTVITIVGRAAESVAVFGYESDRERVEVMFTSLLVQATRDMMRADAPPWENIKTFRRSWFEGFASTVGARIKQAEAVAEREPETTASTSTALVLADRKSLVERAYRDAYRGLRKERVQPRSGSGYHAGAAAGRRADLGGARVGAGRAGALTR